jgi:hypothetical protein
MTCRRASEEERLLLDQAVRLKASQDAAEVTGVDVKRSPELNHFGRVPQGQFEYDARLGE